jgi:hypothetical protein
MMAAAASQKSSGIPSISNPEKVAFQAADRFIAVTTGIPKGLKNPKTNKVIPRLKRQPGNDGALELFATL